MTRWPSIYRNVLRSEANLFVKKIKEQYLFFFNYPSYTVTAKNKNLTPIMGKENVYLEDLKSTRKDPRDKIGQTSGYVSLNG